MSAEKSVIKGRLSDVAENNSSACSICARFMRSPPSTSHALLVEVLSQRRRARLIDDEFSVRARLIPLIVVSATTTEKHNFEISNKFKDSPKFGFCDSNCIN